MSVTMPNGYRPMYVPLLCFFFSPIFSFYLLKLVYVRGIVRRSGGFEIGEYWPFGHHGSSDPG